MDWSSVRCSFSGVARKWHPIPLLRLACRRRSLLLRTTRPCRRRRTTRQSNSLRIQQQQAPAFRSPRRPSGAHVTIDGGAGNARRLAAAAAPITTPATIHLPPGDYTFTITKPGTGTAGGTVKVERNADVNLNITLSNSTVADRLPEFDVPRLHYWHTELFGPRLGVSLIEEHQYYPARDDEADKRIVLLRCGPKGGVREYRMR